MAPAVSSNMTAKRIQREILDLQKEDIGDIKLAPVETNIHLWKGSIPGPEGSVYEGGVFDVEIVLPNDYPFSAPKVLFKTKIYHMNISENGNVCIDILKSQWSPALSLFKVMLSLSSLLTDPNPKDPLVGTIASQYSRSRKVHDTTARAWTEKYAKPKPAAALPPPPPPQPTTSSRARGKQRAEAPPNGAGSSSSSSNVATASSSRSQNRNRVAPSDEVIVLTDSDDDAMVIGNEPVRKNKKRKRAAHRLGEDNSTSMDNEIIDLADEAEQPPPSRKRRGGAGGGEPSRARRGGRSGAAPEVIVIDED